METPSIEEETTTTSTTTTTTTTSSSSDNNNTTTNNAESRVYSDLNEKEKQLVENVKGKVKAAQMLFDEQDFLSSCELLASSLSTLSPIYGDLSIELAPIYVKYGKSLLFSYKVNESDFLGSKVKEQKEEGGEASEEEEEQSDEKEESKTAESKENPQENNKKEEQDDTLELTWEVLESARVIYSRAGKEKELDLSDVHMLLGDLNVEMENHKVALEEYEIALNLRQKQGKKYERDVAEVYYYIGLLHQITNDSKLAEDSYKKAIHILSDVLDQYQKEEKSPDDIQDLKNVILDLQMRLDEVVPIDTSQEPKPKEFQKELIQQMIISTSLNNPAVTPDTPNVNRFGTVGRAAKKAPQKPDTTNNVSITPLPAPTTDSTVESKPTILKTKRRLEDLMGGGNMPAFNTTPSISTTTSSTTTNVTETSSTNTNNTVEEPIIQQDDKKQKLDH